MYALLTARRLSVDWLREAVGADDPMYVCISKQLSHRLLFSGGTMIMGIIAVMLFMILYPNKNEMGGVPGVVVLPVIFAYVVWILATTRISNSKSGMFGKFNSYFDWWYSRVPHATGLILKFTDAQKQPIYEEIRQYIQSCQEV